KSAMIMNCPGFSRSASNRVPMYPMMSLSACCRSQSTSESMIRSGSAQRTTIVWLKLRFTGCPPTLCDRSPLRLRHAVEIEEAGRSAFDGAARLRRHAQKLAHFPDRPVGDLVVVDFEQVDTVALAHGLAAPDRVGHALVHPAFSHVALPHVAVEETGR